MLIGGVTVILSLAYAVWQTSNFYGWKRNTRRPNPYQETEDEILPNVTLLIPYRNEAANLPGLITSLKSQDYSQVDFLFINDHSTDGSEVLFANLPPAFHSIDLADYSAYINSKAHKKSALTLGIDLAKGDIIITTDADCHWPPSAVSGIVKVFQRGADVVLGPVFIAPAHNFLEGFQALDLAGYQLYTAATSSLANGASFAFRKQLFLDVGGYSGVDHLPSGDDVLLLHKFRQHLASPPLGAGGHIAPASAPKCLVDTKPVPTWKALWRQRVRWAGKAGEYTDKKLKRGQALAFLTALMILVALVTGHWLAGLIAWTIKGIIDYVLLRGITHHFGRWHLMRWYLQSQLIYPFYLVAVGGAALLGVKSSWKGRR